MTQHQLAKWCDADIIIYIGWERCNEMTNVLEEFGVAGGPKDRESFDGADDVDRQYLQYAGGSA